MRIARCGVLGFIISFVAWASPVRSDILLLNDGTIVEGSLVKQDRTSLTWRVDVADGAQDRSISLATATRVVVTDKQGAWVSDATLGQQAATMPATRPARRSTVPAEPPPPPLGKLPAGSAYYLIPLHGEVGETVRADALEKSLADAVARKPGVVVLDIESPGGSVDEAEKMIAVMHRFNRQLRIVALAGEDLSAAAVFSMSVRTIYVKPAGTIGAATAFVPDTYLPPNIEEKMQSAWRAVARNSAEEGGHEPLLANAMIDSSMTLHLETVAGKPVVKEGDGEKILCRQGKILTLTSQEAVACGLAAGKAEDLSDLGTALGMRNWKECPGLGTLMAEYLPRRNESFNAQLQTILADFNQNMLRAMESDPSSKVATERTLVWPKRAGTSGVGVQGRTAMPAVRISSPDVRPLWKARSLTCVLALQQAEQNLKELTGLCEDFGRPGEEAAALNDALTSVRAARARVFEDRNKYGREAAPASAATQNTVVQKQATVPQVQQMANVSEAIRALESKDPKEMTKAAQCLATAPFREGDQRRVLELLRPCVEHPDPRKETPFLQALARWGNKDDVGTFIHVLESPANLEKLPPGQDQCWDAAIAALVRLDPAAAEGVLSRRAAEPLFRDHLKTTLQTLAAAGEADKDVALRLLGALNPPR